MAILSRRYLLASRDVVTELGFRWSRRRLPGLLWCKPHLCDLYKTRWNSFLRYRPPASPERERWRAGLSKTAITFFGIGTIPIAYYFSRGTGKETFKRVKQILLVPDRIYLRRGSSTWFPSPRGRGWRGGGVGSLPTVPPHSGLQSGLAESEVFPRPIRLYRRWP